MKTIIVPTDFSPVATNALNYAVEMALAIDASIYLLNVFQIPVSLSEVPMVTLPYEELKQMSDEKLHELKKDVEHISSGKLKVYAESRLGTVSEELEEICKMLTPFAVVMGTKGSSGLERLFIGSNTLSTIRHLTFPVIVVPPGARFTGIKKIGFACDMQKVVETTPTETLHQFCTVFNAELHVLNVDFKNKHFTAETPEESLLLHTMLNDLQPKFHFIEHPDVEKGVDEFAEKNNLDLIVTIPKKHNILDAIFQRNHTRDLIFHSHVPILCIHE